MGFVKLADAQAEQLYANEQSAQKIGEYSKEAQAAIAASQEDFTSRLGTLANTVAANHKQMERNFEELSGVIRTYEEAGDADRALIRQQNDALNTAMTQKIADTYLSLKAYAVTADAEIKKYVAAG